MLHISDSDNLSQFGRPLSIAFEVICWNDTMFIKTQELLLIDDVGDAAHTKVL